MSDPKPTKCAFAFGTAHRDRTIEACFHDRELHAEIAALRAKLLRVQEKLDGTIEERDVIAVECAARGDEVRRLDAVILDGRTIIYHSAFHDERVGDQYRYPQIRAWVVSAIPVREARALKEGEP